MENSRKVILYIAASLDGYIAKPNDDLSFLSMVEQEGEDYGYVEFLESIDTIIIGRRTFDWVCNEVGKYPDEDKKIYIVSRTSKSENGLISYYSGKLKNLIMRLKTEPGKNIFVNGGAQIVKEMLKDNLIDEMIISIIPVLLGNGTRLFQEIGPEYALKLVSSKEFTKGLIQLHYIVL